MDLRSRPISRRSLLRSTLLGGAGLTGAYLLGCSDEDAGPDVADLPTLTPDRRVRPPAGSERVARAGEQRLTPGLLPPPRKHHSLVRGQPADGSRLYLFGGQNDSGDLADFWQYDPLADEWIELPPPGPGPRHGHNAVWDSVNGRMLVFGGQRGPSFFNDTWQYDPAAARWAELSPAGPIPEARYGAGGAFSPSVAEDDPRPFLPESFIVTHGFTANGRFDDSWALDVTTDSWSEVTPPDVSLLDKRPVERCLMRAIWDTLRNRVIIYGGQTTEEPFLDDLWTLSSGRGWSTLQREPRPSPRTFYSFVFDGTRNEALLFGGNTAAGAESDIWVLHIQDEFWTREQPDGDRPSARFGHDAVFLEDSSTMLVFGGNDGSSDLNELWELRVIA